jgi:ribosomal protein S9
MQPMSMTNATNFDVKVNVYGGGSTGQAEAVRMALARVMCEVNLNRLILKPEGLLTRDPRMVERKNSVRRKLVRNFNSRNVNIACLEYMYSRLSLLLNLKQCCCCPVEAGN